MLLLVCQWLFILCINSEMQTFLQTHFWLPGICKLSLLSTWCLTYISLTCFRIFIPSLHFHYTSFLSSERGTHTTSDHSALPQRRQQMELCCLVTMMTWMMKTLKTSTVSQDLYQLMCRVVAGTKVKYWLWKLALPKTWKLVRVQLWKHFIFFQAVSCNMEQKIFILTEAHTSKSQQKKIFSILNTCSLTLHS